jgi:hypothetical protein
MQHHNYDDLEQCPICIELADPSVAEVCMLEQCGHVFHSACLQCALIEKNACPICRSEITSCQHEVHSAATLLEENRMLRAALSGFKQQKQEFDDNNLAQMMQRHEQRAHVDHGDPLFNGRGRHRVSAPTAFRISSSRFNRFVSSDNPEEHNAGAVHVPVDGESAYADYDPDIYQLMGGTYGRLRALQILRQLSSNVHTH